MTSREKTKRYMVSGRIRDCSVSYSTASYSAAVSVLDVLASAANVFDEIDGTPSSAYLERYRVITSPETGIEDAATGKTLVAVSEAE